jgi:thymidylate kinase
MVAEAELFMLLASRAASPEANPPRLDAGDVVICDRFSDASLAYQEVVAVSG